MGLHGPNASSRADLMLPTGIVVSLILDDGNPQGVAYSAVWWRLIRSLPPATAKIAALEAMLPAPAQGITVTSETCAESAWYHGIDLPGACAAAKAGTLDQFWAGRASAAWWSAQPMDVRAGFTTLLAGYRNP